MLKPLLIHLLLQTIKHRSYILMKTVKGKRLHISKLYENDPNFINFKNECSKTGTTEESIANAEKIGFKTDLSAINPLDENIKVPVYFANFVLMDYGFGAVFGCPAHDQRDFDFAKKYNLEIKTVVRPKDKNIDFKVTDILRGEDHMTNSAAQIQLFEALESIPPRLGHLSLLTDISGEGLSKRLGSLSLRDLRKEGFQPMALSSLLSKVGTSDSIAVSYTHLRAHET